MKFENIKTLGELKKSGYESKSIKDEYKILHFVQDDTV